MRWTTANSKSPNYIANHEIYVGTHTGSFKKLVPNYQESPFVQEHLLDLKSLDHSSRITALSFGNDENSEILIGRLGRTAQLYCLGSQQVVRTVELQSSPVVGIARLDDRLIGAFGDGQVQCISLNESTETDRLAKDSILWTAGDDISRLRQCPTQRNLIATGGKDHKNNLKVFDVNAGGKEIFKSKNLPNDYLQLEVPVWDSDVGFIDSAYTLATCSRHGYVRVYDTRKQRRPVQCFATDDQMMGFSTLAARGNYIYTGTTTGAAKAFDIRRMKTFIHSYKGFTGAVSDLHLDSTGKYLASASLDRYVRVHNVDSGELLYQCYVKSKAMRLLIRESVNDPNSNANNGLVRNDEELDERGTATEGKTKKVTADDKEYDEMFDNMQAIRESGESDEDAEEAETSKSMDQKVGIKRKNDAPSRGSKRKL